MVGSFDDISAKLSASFEANERRLSDNQAKFHTTVEARNAKFNAELEALAPLKLVAPANQVSRGKSPPSRKRRLWLYPSKTR